MCLHRSSFAATASSEPRLLTYHYVHPASIYPMTRSGPLRRKYEQGTRAGFQAITYCSASNLDTGTSDTHQTGRYQACLVHVLQVCVFACSYIRPANTYSCWLGRTGMGQAPYQLPSARRHGTVPARHMLKLNLLRPPCYTTRTPPAAAEPDRSR